MSLMRTIDLTGQSFGRLTVLARAGSNADNKAVWRCLCSCGSESLVSGKLLRNGMTKSCGCLSREASRERGLRHGRAGSSEHRIWKAMRQRCENPRNEAYARYGGRGILVCERWQVFEQFLADMGPRPTSAHTVERKDNSLGYSPENCIWALPIVQGNNKRNNRTFEFEGRSLTLAQWARETGVARTTISERLRRGWSVGRALMLVQS